LEDHPLIAILGCLCPCPSISWLLTRIQGSTALWGSCCKPDTVVAGSSVQCRTCNAKSALSVDGRSIDEEEERDRENIELLRRTRPSQVGAALQRLKLKQLMRSVRAAHGPKNPEVAEMFAD